MTTSGQKTIAAKLQAIEEELQLEKAHYGAAAQLWHEGILEKVLPCEDETLLDAAKPIAADGTYREDAEAIEAREDFIVQTLLESGPVPYVILGGSHDLADNVERLSGGQAEYLRVELEAWRFAERRIVAVDVSEGSCPNVGVKRAEVRNRRPHAKRPSLSPQRISPTSHNAVERTGY